MNSFYSADRRLGWGIVVAAISALSYLALLKNDFLLWDDDKYIIENPYIRTLGWSLVKRAFTDFMQGNWHPLTLLSHAVDYALWGLNPAGHHFTSIVIHSLNAFLVVLLVVRILDLWHWDCPDGQWRTTLANHSVAAAAITGIMFGIHPLHVESVAWASERKDLLCGLFYLAALYCYCKPNSLLGLEPGFRTIISSRTLQATLFFFLLALMSKPMAVSLPLVLLVFDRYLLRRINSGKQTASAIFEKWPFIIPALLVSVATMLAQKSGVTANHAEMVPLYTRLLVAARSLLLYLLKMVAPVDLLPVYPYPLQDEVSITAFPYLVPLVFVLAITFLLIRSCKRPCWWQPFLLFYIITLLPVIGIIQVGAQSMADRYTYLPSLAPFVLGSIAVTSLWQKSGGKASRWILFAAGLCYTVTLVWLTQNQIVVWRNSLVFWSSVIAQEPSRVPFAYINRGVAYQKKGDLSKALDDLNMAVEMTPTDFNALNSRGMVLMERGLLEKALADFDKAISLRIADSGAYYNRGLLFRKKGERGKALEDFTMALAINPADIKARNTRGLLLQEMEDYDKALADFNAALDVDPSDAMIFNNRGLLLAAKGEIDRAIADYDTAARLKPQESSTYINRGLALSAKGEFDKALVDFNSAIRLKPDESRAYNNRGITNAQKGSMQLSLDDFTKALELDPSFAEVYVNRGLLLLKVGDAALARQDFARACEFGEKRGCGFLQ